MGHGNLKLPCVRCKSSDYQGVIVLCQVCRCEMWFAEAWRTGGPGGYMWRFFCADHVHLA